MAASSERVRPVLAARRAMALAGVLLSAMFILVIRRAGHSRSPAERLRMKIRRAPLLDVLLTLLAAGHTGEPLETARSLDAWSFDPGVVLPSALAAFLYARGRARCARRLIAAERACFWTGWPILALALVSPLIRSAKCCFPRTWRSTRF